MHITIDDAHRQAAAMAVTLLLPACRGEEVVRGVGNALVDHRMHWRLCSAHQLCPSTRGMPQNSPRLGLPITNRQWWGSRSTSGTQGRPTASSSCLLRITLTVPMGLGGGGSLGPGPRPRGSVSWRRAALPQMAPVAVFRRLAISE